MKLKIFRKFLGATLLFFFSTISNIIAEEIVGYCLVTTIDLSKSNLAPEDHNRFLGKVITIAISFEENLIGDFSEDDEMTMITGLFDGVATFTKTPYGIKYSTEMLVGENEKDQVKYKYDNKVKLISNKIIEVDAFVDQSGFNFNEWKFKISCKETDYTDEEKKIALDTKAYFKFEEEKLKKLYDDINIKEKQ